MSRVGEIAKRLDKKFKKTVLIGEIPYQSNRDAVENLSIFFDMEEGKRDLITLIDGIDAFVVSIEGLMDEARMVSRKVQQLLR